MMKRISTPKQLEELFIAYDRNNFSYEGYEALLNFYDSIDDNAELDVIGICSEWTEYTPEEFVDEYIDYLDFDEYDVSTEDELYSAIDEGEVDIDDCADDLYEILQGYTTVIELDNYNYLVELF